MTGHLPLGRRLALVLGAAAALACNTPTVPQSTGVSGTYDLALVGDFVFVTSADKSELRAIDTTKAPRDFARAPNPLEALSIPVLPRPQGLGRDVTYGADGQEVTGPYVYAFAAARAEISVVGADRTILREVRRIATDGPVTALSARGPGTGTSSTLFYATYLGGESRLYSLTLPPAGQDPGQIEDPTLTLTPTLLATYPNESILSLQALPSSDEVAVATRTVGATTGRTFTLAPATLATRTMLFPGPVRALGTHPGTADLTVPAQALLFGLLDESACGGAGCGALWAVTVATGQIAPDLTGQPMLPIRFTRGLPVSFTFAPSAAVRTSSSLDPVTFPLLGMVTNTDGQVVFFDAWGLRHINQAIIIPVATSFFLLNEALAAVPYDDALFGLAQSSAVPGLGAAVDDTDSILFEGEIPDLVKLPTAAADGQRFLAPAAARARAQLGDHLLLTLQDGTLCATELAVSDTNDGGDALATVDAIPPECATRASFTVRAAGAQPYVVTGLVSGYMGRVGDNQTFTFLGTPYFRPDGSNPLAPLPALTFQMRDRFPTIARDFRYTLTTSSGFTPLFFQLNTDPFGGFAGYHLPHGVVHLPGVSAAFVSYPSVPRTTNNPGNGAVVEFVPSLMLPSQLNVTVIRTYR